MNHLGSDGFRWFFAQVKDLNDPDMLGHVKIRVHGSHDNVPDEDLLWAIPINPIQSASLLGVGISPTGIEIDSWVFGFYADGVEANLPVIVGTIAQLLNNEEAQHGVSRLAREDNNIVKELLGPEPKSPYASKYPFNKTITTKSGHAIELDDTEGAERIHVYHKSGSYIEIAPDGRVVFKSAADSYHIVAGNEEVYVQGNVNIHVVGNVTQTVDGDVTMNVNGEATLTAQGVVNITGSEVNIG